MRIHLALAIIGLLSIDAAHAQLTLPPASSSYRSGAQRTAYGRSAYPTTSRRQRAAPATTLASTRGDPDLEALQSLASEDDEVATRVAAAWRQALGEKFERTPAAVLQAILQRQKLAGTPLAAPVVSEQPLPAPAAPSKEEEESDTPAQAVQADLSPLAAHVLSGDFAALGKLLESLPVEQSRPAYGAIISALASESTSVILPEEMLALLDLAPAGALTDLRLAQLGQLLKQSLLQAERPAALLVALKSGKLRLGEDELSHRIAATKLLLTAGLLAEAQTFLPELPPDLAPDASLAGLHARHAWLSGASTRDEMALSKAWRLTHAVLMLPEAEPRARAAAQRRALALALVLPDQVKSWLREVFRDQPEHGLALLTEFSVNRRTAYLAQDEEGRRTAIQSQHLAGLQMLAVRAPLEQRFALALEAITRDWIHESQKALGGNFHKIHLGNEGQSSPLPMPLLLAAAPTPAWRQALDADTGEHVRHLTGMLAVRLQDAAAAHAILQELAPLNPQLAREVAEALVVKSGEGNAREDENDLDPFGSSLNARQRRMMGMSSQQSQGAVTTRAGQLRKLAELKALLEKFQGAGVPPLSDGIVVEAFNQCHSSAEVYLEDDIAQIFGSLEKFSPDTALALATRMRKNLAEQWRDPQLQQQQGTRRTTPEQIAELRRGYDLARTLVMSALARSPKNIDLELTLAGLYFDQAEFLYGLQVDLKTYIAFRDAAFAHFQAAAAALAEPEVRNSETRASDSLNVFCLWFQAALGTSDLAYLTRQDEPDKAQVQLLRDAVNREPAIVRAALAQAFSQSLNQVPATLKPHYVRQALAIVGEEPIVTESSGKDPVTQLLERRDFYDELLKEVELRVAVDGSDRVGHGRPFGLEISLMGTRAMVRENSAFAQILQVAAVQQVDATAAHKLLEADLRDKLGQSFTLDQLVFYPPQTEPRELARSGWQSLPIAYAVVRAKDPSIDRLPSVQFDLDFADGAGEVRLPVRSEVVLLDCRSADPPPRLAREVKLRQVLDDRELATGVVRWEVAALGHGVAPELDQLLANTEVPGFTTRRITEQELSVTGFDLTRHLQPLVQRRWLVELAPSPGEPVPEFEFPAAADKSQVVSLQRYADADIVETTAAAPLHWPVLQSAHPWLWATVGAICLVLIVVSGAYVARGRRGPVPAPAYCIPERVTPFGLIALLRRIEQDPALELSTSERRDLSDTLAQIERQFFTSRDNGALHDLEPICRHWVRRAVTC
jgi:hypothetical protein